MNTVIDEIQFLVNTSGSEDFGFSFTRISDIRILDPALCRIASLELWILGYSVGTVIIRVMAMKIH